VRTLILAVSGLILVHDNVEHPMELVLDAQWLRTMALNRTGTERSEQLSCLVQEGTDIHQFHRLLKSARRQLSPTFSEQLHHLGIKRVEPRPR